MSAKPANLLVHEKPTIDLIVFGRTHALSQMLRNSVRKLLFSEPAGSLGEEYTGVRSFKKRDYSRVTERLLLDTPSSYNMGREDEEGGERDQDLKLRPSKPWEEAWKVDVPPVIQYLAAKQTRC